MNATKIHRKVEEELEELDEVPTTIGGLTTLEGVAVMLQFNSACNWSFVKLVGKFLIILLISSHPIVELAADDLPIKVVGTK